jgi:sporulation protein YlmC with PRC-barrel domain
MNRVRHLSALLAMLSLCAVPMLAGSVRAQNEPAGQEGAASSGGRSAEPPAAQDAATQAATLVPESQLIGMDVVNEKGETLGKLQDVALDPTGSRVLYGVLAHGGGLLSTAKLFAVPWSALKPDLDKKQVRIRASVAALEEAPGLDPNRWPGDAAVQWTAEGPRAQPAERDGAVRAGPMSKSQGEDVSSTGQGTAASESSGGSAAVDKSDASGSTAQMGQVQPMDTVLKASALLGTEVQDPLGESLGKIQDLPADPQSGHVTYAVLTTGGFLGIGAKRIALPIDAIRFGSPDGQVRSSVKRAQIAKAPALDGLPVSPDLSWTSASGT